MVKKAVCGEESKLKLWIFWIKLTKVNAVLKKKKATDGFHGPDCIEGTVMWEHLRAGGSLQADAGERQADVIMEVRSLSTAAGDDPIIFEKEHCKLGPLWGSLTSYTYHSGDYVNTQRGQVWSGYGNPMLPPRCLSGYGPVLPSP